MHLTHIDVSLSLSQLSILLSLKINGETSSGEDSKKKKRVRDNRTLGLISIQANCLAYLAIAYALFPPAGHKRAQKIWTTLHKPITTLPKCEVGFPLITMSV